MVYLKPLICRLTSFHQTKHTRLSQISSNSFFTDFYLIVILFIFAVEKTLCSYLEELLSRWYATTLIVHIPGARW
jgi:hypothetical protein